MLLASAWREIDPSASYQDAVAAALKTGSRSVDALFGSPLRFGTAGLRGQLGPGPGAMNRVLVRLVAAALGTLVRSTGGDHVVIGYDARRQSDEFALDTARVLAGQGVRTTVIDEPRPTPLLAFAVRDLGADAGVMVTASHNPRADNGYKVYGGDGALLAGELAEELAHLMEKTPLVSDADLSPTGHELITQAGSDLIDRYVTRISALTQPDTSRQAQVAYTALHGVGTDLLQQVFKRAGFADPVIVSDQAEPDGEFPTTPFPNPEEPGVLNQLFAVASAANSDLAIANDPDADRLAVALPDEDGWRLLSGDELGSLLADYLLSTRQSTKPDRLVINTIVSSRLLAEIAEHHGAAHEQTLTGFKWIMQAQAHRRDAEFVMGYEEALGYAIGQDVRDKDGISAALIVAEMASALAVEGKTLSDALDDLHRRHGVHQSGQRAIRYETNGPTTADIMQWLRNAPPQQLAGYEIGAVVDLLNNDGPLPPTDGLVLHFDDARIIVRPSGTEPKLKLYGECWRPPGDDLGPSRSDVHRQLSALLGAMSSLVADPERAATAKRLHTQNGDTALEAQAASLFASAPQTLGRNQALRLVVESIDLTTLAGDDTFGRVRALCAQARRPDPADPTVGPTAAICVYPNLVALVSELTKGSGVAVASVASAFPSGLSSLEVRLSDIAEAVCAGADEIDVVINRAAFLQGQEDLVLDELRAMRQQIGSRSMKVILETSELETPAAIRSAAKLAIRAGADWIKTSTGKTSLGATPYAVLAMAQAIAATKHQQSHPVGLKVSGGVRTSADALGYLAIIEATLGAEWLQPSRVRFGASGLLSAVVEDLATNR